MKDLIAGVGHREMEDYFVAWQEAARCYGFWEVNKPFIQGSRSMMARVHRSSSCVVWRKG